MTDETRQLGRPSRRRFLGASLAVGVSGVGGLGATGRWVKAVQPLPRTLRDKVGQLFVVSFRGLAPDSAFVSLMEQRGFGGVILFSRNCQAPEQVRTLVGTLRHASRYPLLVCTDQEGGQVIRIRAGVRTFPSEATYGRLGSMEQVQRDAGITAHDLRALGVNMNLAPVLDVLGSAQSPIGDRSFGSDPHLAARLGVAAIRGYQQEGMAATAKHFVGLGHSLVDSHHALPTVDQSPAQLEKSDLIPFRAAIGAGVSTILVAHVALPAIDPSRRPASLSHPVIHGLLRSRLGFRGVVMTDSLVMGALPQGGGAAAAEEALKAGADLLLLGANYDLPSALFEDAVERIVSAVRAGRISEHRLDRSLARIFALKRRYP